MSSVMLTRARILLLCFLPIFALFGISSAYVTSVHVPAVLGNTNTGIISSIQLNITSGNGTVRIIGPSDVGQSTLLSAQIGAAYASKFTGINESRYNFTYTIYDNFSNVTGPSGGLAFTLLAISGIRQVPLNQNFTLTGTISSNGEIGAIGGITDKVSAAKSFGLKYVLAPAVQNESFENMLYYFAQQYNNIPIVEVANVSQAIPYAFSNNTATVFRVGYNETASNYALSNLGQAPFNCNTICNTTYFGNLSNYTFSMAAQEIAAIPSNFSSISSQLSASLSIYENIAKKGYLYAGADQAFLGYIDAYTFANANNMTLNKAYSLLGTVSNYCNGLTPPQLTTRNYGYVISGEARQAWALQNLNTAKTILNQSQSTDNIIEAVSTIGESSAWCAAASNLYSQFQYPQSTASAVGLSDKIAQLASRVILQNKQYSNSMYYNAAVADYNLGEYGASLYSLAYINSIYSTTNYPSNYSLRTLYNSLNSSLYGIWPIEYANSAAFYAYEASVSANSSTSKGYLLSSYPLSVLAINISSLNKILASNLTSPIAAASTFNNGLNATSVSTQLLGIIGEEATSINNLQYTVNTIKLVLELIIVMVLVLLLALFYFISREFNLRRKILLSKKRGTRRR